MYIHTALYALKHNMIEKRGGVGGSRGGEKDDVKAEVEKKRM